MGLQLTFVLGRAAAVSPLTPRPRPGDRPARRTRHGLHDQIRHVAATRRRT
jgi:hypothetical protein